MRKLINLFVFAAIAGTTLQSCKASDKCYDVVNGQTVQVPCTSNNGNTGTVNPGTKVFTLWGNIPSCSQAFGVSWDKQNAVGYIQNKPSGNGSMYQGGVDPTWRVITVTDAQKNNTLVLISEADYAKITSAAIWDNIANCFKERASGKKMYYNTFYTGFPVGCTYQGGLVPSYVFNDGQNHYYAEEANIYYKVSGITFQ